MTYGYRAIADALSKYQKNQAASKSKLVKMTRCLVLFISNSNCLISFIRIYICTSTLLKQLKLNTSHFFPRKVMDFNSRFIAMRDINIQFCS